MNRPPRSALLLAGTLACHAISASAADRIRAGQWEQTVNIAGKAVTQTRCISKADADAINGDERSIRAYLEKLPATTG